MMERDRLQGEQEKKFLQKRSTMRKKGGEREGSPKKRLLVETPSVKGGELECICGSCGGIRYDYKKKGSVMHGERGREYMEV